MADEPFLLDRKARPAVNVRSEQTGSRAHASDVTPSNHYSTLLATEEGLGLGKRGYTSDSRQVHPL